MQHTNKFFYHLARKSIRKQERDAIFALAHEFAKEMVNRIKAQKTFTYNNYKYIVIKDKGILTLDVK